MKKSFILLALAVIVVGSVVSQNSITENDIIGTWRDDSDIRYVFDAGFEAGDSVGRVTLTGGAKGVYAILGEDDEDIVIIINDFPAIGKKALSGDKKTLTLRDNSNNRIILTKLDDGKQEIKEATSPSGRYYASRTSYEFKGNKFSGFFGSTPIFWGTFTISDNNINLHITGGVDGDTSEFATFTIIDVNTISGNNGILYKRR